MGLAGLPLVILAGLLGAGTTSPFRQSSTDLTPLWRTTIDVVAARLSSTGQCVGVVTPNDVTVFDHSGKVLWSWPFKANNRFAEFRQIAVSPDCTAIAVVGDSSYRYTWIAHQNGRRAYVAHKSTPEGVAFNHRGNLVAVGTAANQILLLTADGSVQWERPSGTDCCVVMELEFAAADDAIVVTSWGASVMNVDGTLRFATHAFQNGMHASTDLQAFAAWAQPNHGPGIGGVEYLDRNGAILWSKFSSYGGAAISPTGDFVASWVNDNQNPTAADEFADQSGAVRLIGRDGVVRNVLAPKGEPLTFSKDGKLVLIMTPQGLSAVDLTGTERWRISRAQYLDVNFTADLRALIAVDSGTLSWFTTPASIMPR